MCDGEGGGRNRERYREGKKLPPFADGDEISHRAPRLRRTAAVVGERKAAFRERVRGGWVGVVVWG